MQRPLPVDHVILVMNEQAVLEDAAGVNFGFAISGLPGFEEGEGATISTVSRQLFCMKLPTTFGGNTPAGLMKAWLTLSSS